MYAKVYKSLWEGTLAGTGEVWAVFVFLLAHCDREGFVDIHPGVVAALTGFEEGRVREALRSLEAPDAQSRTAEDGGARIIRLDEHRDWGWQIVNYVKYRTMVDAETRRAQVREAVSRHRNRASSPVITSKPQKAHAEAEAEAEGEAIEHLSNAVGRDPVIDPPIRKKSPSKDWRESFSSDFWPAYPRKVAKGAAEAAWFKLGSGLSREEEVALFNAVMDGLERWKLAHKDTEEDFIPHPATWINQRHWEDESR
jgi:hypothetical protein